MELLQTWLMVNNFSCKNASECRFLNKTFYYNLLYMGQKLPIKIVAWMTFCNPKFCKWQSLQLTYCNMAWKFQHINCLKQVCTNLLSTCCSTKIQEPTWQIINMSVMSFCHGLAAFNEFVLQAVNIHFDHRWSSLSRLALWGFLYPQKKGNPTHMLAQIPTRAMPGDW